jgi:glycosyltransferase involved in cell wall biosynthesis
MPKSTEKRVLVIARHPVGGIRTYILYNYPCLAEAGYRFTFVVPASAAGLSGFRTELSAWNGTEVIEAPATKERCALRPIVRALLREGRFSLIHSHGFTAAVHTVFANLGIGIPHVVTSHDVIRADQYPGPLGLAKRWAIARVLDRADVLIAVGKDACANHHTYLPSIGRQGCKLVTIPNGIDTTRFNGQGDLPSLGLRATLGISHDRFLVGFLGRFMPQKGFLGLLDAMEQLVRTGPPRPFHLVAVGSGDYLREYRGHAEQRGLLGRYVSFIDFAADVRPILRQLDLLVMPSLWEALPLLPAEAMCVGVPVLGSDCIGLREVLQGTPSRMVQHGNAESLAAGFRAALTRPWKDEAIAYAPEARQRFDIRRSAEQLRELFDALIR